MADTTTSDVYNYDPSVAAAILFAVLFGATCLFTIFQYLQKRAWFWFFMVFGSIMETAGYVSRCISVENITSRTPYIIQFLLIFLAPAIVAASCYMAMGRVVLYVTPIKYRTMKVLWVSPRAMTPIFVTCDVIAFLVQVYGGFQSTNADHAKQTQGYNIMKIGLGIQLACFGLFLVISCRFHFVARQFRETWPDLEWPQLLWAINMASVLIFIRSIYRMIEFAQGADGYLTNHEWNFYVFESSVILPVFMIFNAFHPAKYLSNVGWRQKRDGVELNQRWTNTSDHQPLR